MLRDKPINRFFSKARQISFLLLELSIFFTILGCSTITHTNTDENYPWTFEDTKNAGGVTEITPPEMKPEQRNPTSPIDKSPYLMKKMEKINVLSPKEESLEGSEEYYLGYHDILRITIFGRHDPEKGATADITRDTEIRDDGMISYPLIGDLKAAGLTIPELQNNIIEKLREYITDPKIDTQIIQYGSRNVSILGEVKKPQVIYLKGKTTLLEAIAETEGLTDKANLKGAYIVRQNKIIPIDLHALIKEGELKYNVELKRKDIVYIPNIQDQRVYVIGEVKNPGIVPFAGKILTVAEVIGSTGDFKVSAKKNNIKIIRGGLEKPTLITVNFNKIIDGDIAENIELRSEDIVFVPASLVGEWNKILEQITPSLQTLLFGLTVQSLTGH